MTRLANQQCISGLQFASAKEKEVLLKEAINRCVREILQGDPEMRFVCKRISIRVEFED